MNKTRIAKLEQRMTAGRTSAPEDRQAELLDSVRAKWERFLDGELLPVLPGGPARDLLAARLGRGDDL